MMQQGKNYHNVVMQPGQPVQVSLVPNANPIRVPALRPGYSVVPPGSHPTSVAAAVSTAPKISLVRPAVRAAAPPSQGVFNIHIIKPPPQSESDPNQALDKAFQVSNLRFHANIAPDWSKLASETQLSIQTREDPRLSDKSEAADKTKFGEGTAYGFEARDAARRRRWLISSNKFDSTAPSASSSSNRVSAWSLVLGQGRQKKTFQAVNEARAVDNSAYFVMKQAGNNRIEAYYVDDWFNMVPPIAYSYLNEEEAEEEFSKRHKTHNHYNLMMKRRVAQESGENSLDGGDDGMAGDDMDGARGGKGGDKKKKSALKRDDFMLTEDGLDDEGSDEEATSDEDSDGAKPKKKAAAGKNAGKNANKRKKKATEKASEESDLDDHEGDEIDYMSTSSDEEAMAEDDRAKIYAEGGVEDERGLRGALNDAAEYLEEEGEEDEEGSESDAENKKAGDDGSGNAEESGADSGDDSGSDDDYDEDDSDEARESAPGKARPSSAAQDSSGTGDAKSSGTAGSMTGAERGAGGQASTSSTKSLKRSPTDETDNIASSSKKSKVSSANPPNRLFATTSVLDKLSQSKRADLEELVRKYLLRKPVTASDLIKKVRQKNLVPADIDISELMVALLSKINPEKIKVKNVQMLHLRK